MRISVRIEGELWIPGMGPALLKIEASMDRDIAIRLDGMLIGAGANLDRIAHYMKNNLSDEEYKNQLISIGKSIGALIEISKYLYSRFPDICPKELQPPANGGDVNSTDQ
jgi:hypothetical protein